MNNELIKITLLKETQRRMMREIENERLIRLNKAARKSHLGAITLWLRSLRKNSLAWASSWAAKTFISSFDAS